MKRSNNKILFIVLIVLVGGFVLTRVFRAPSLERNIDETLLTLDTSKVRGIHISPAIQTQKEIRLIRSGNDWQLQQDKRNARAEMRQVKTALGSLAAIKADRVLTRKKEKWASYNVDTAGTRVKIVLGQNDLKEFWVGKMNGGGSSIRLEDENDVYETRAPLEGNFNKNFNEWRDKTFLKVQPENISKITFQYPGDSSFVLIQSANKWQIDNVKADSSNVQTYLNRFRSRFLQDFDDDFTPSEEASYTVTLDIRSTAPVAIKAWQVQKDRWVLNSSQQQDVYFSSADPSVIRDLFVGKSSFVSR
jgi:hypothetical protein